MSLRPLFLLPLLIFTLSACQQTAWKSGASADDLKRDEQTCRAQTPADDAATKQCLRDKGWTVTDYSAPATGESVAPATAALPVAAQPAATPASPTTNTAPSATAGTEKSAIIATPANVAPTAAATSNPAAVASVSAVKPAAPNPLQRRSVQTWWKAGAQAAEFNTDASTCLEQLGTQHTPDYAKHLYTHAMISCLSARGWFAGQDPVYTPLR